MNSKTISEDRVYVWAWLPGEVEPVVAGRISRSADQYLFNYGQTYLSLNKAIPLNTFELPLQSGFMIYSLLETAKINGQHPQRYLSVLLTEIPNAQSAEDIEALLPWNITPDEVSRRYATYPVP